MEFLKLLEGLRTPIGDAFFLFATYGGEEIMLLGLICVLYWCVDKKLAYRMTFSYLPSALVVNTIKISCRVERPWVRDPSFTAVEKAKASATGYSFPSGHTQNATALFGTLAYVFRTTWKKVLIALIIPLVMLSRMYLGVHTPSDVLVSFLVSIVIVMGMNILVDKITLNKKRRFVIMIFLMIITTATMVYTYVLYQKNILAYKDAADTFKGCGAGYGFSLCWFLENEYIQFNPKNSHVGKQILKFIIGLAGALLLKESIKHIFGVNFLTDTIRYFCVILWTMLVMPLIIKKFFQEKP